jgi:hypothetical protein
VVAPSRNAITDANTLTCLSRQCAPVVDMASNDAVFSDSGVQIGNLLAGVSDDHCFGLGGFSRERGCSLLLSGVNDEVTTFCESIERFNQYSTDVVGNVI